MATRTETQSTRILHALERGGAITPLDALRRYGCMRLGARIWELRKRGYKIESERVEVGDGVHVARYRLVTK